MNSKNVFVNTILNSDLNGTIVAGSSNTWNMNKQYGWVLTQNNSTNAYYLYRYTDPSYDRYIDKSLIDLTSNIIDIRFSIEYKE